MIALGLGGFIIMDMTSGQQSLFGGSRMTVGEIEGKQLDWNQFNRTESILYNNSQLDVYVRRDALWNYFVEEAIVSKEAEALGLGVSREELIELEFGPNPSPIIQQRFRNPNTQILDRQRLNEFKTAIENNQLTDPNIRAFWAHQEKEIVKDRLQSKINALVSKAMYTPTWMVEMGYQERNQRIDIAAVKVPYDEVPNTDVSLSDEDFRNYLEENRALYKSDEERRQVAFVVFDVEATPADSAMWRQEIAELIPEFEATKEDSLFVERNFGVYNTAYLDKDELNPDIADTVFNIPVGSVYGPYMEGRFYKAVKVVDKKVVPDSVRSRHILLRATDPTTLMQAQNTIDSLKNLIETGQATFDSLASKFGTDGTSTRGGDLGYVAPGAMVKPFNDLIFYQAEEGKLYTVVTQFGVHLVEVTGRKFTDQEPSVKLAYLQQAIVPSEETQNDLYDEALAFVGNNRTLEQLRESVKMNPRLSLETSDMLSPNGYTVGAGLGSGQASRDIVRWAFSAKVGEVSPEVYIYQDPIEFFNDKYAVVALEDIQEPGLPSVNAIRDQIEAQVINKKKAEIITNQIAGEDLPAIAGDYGVPVDTFNSVTFNQNNIQGLGNEPKVIGIAFSLEENGVSEPIEGNTGVYVVKVLRKPQAGTATNIPQLRRTMSSSVRSQVAMRLMQAMRDNADIEDYRSRFY
jgi:peptidyl-prolyl cis-trans isomerase D